MKNINDFNHNHLSIEITLCYNRISIFKQKRKKGIIKSFENNENIVLGLNRYVFKNHV